MVRGDADKNWHTWHFPASPKFHCYLQYTAVSNGIWGQVCLSSYVFFLLILKDQISLLNGTLYGSPKCTLWTFAKNFMMCSQLTKNGFSPQKIDVFSKNFTEKNTFLETSAPALKGHIVRHHLEKTRTFYLLREKNKNFCVMATHKILNHKKFHSQIYIFGGALAKNAKMWFFIFNFLIPPKGS